MPSVTTTANMTPAAPRTTVEMTARETAVKAPAMETTAETGVMKTRLMKGPKCC
jgi:hypothetical protein